MANVSYAEALVIAKRLKSEDKENPEYDRALLEYLYDAYGLRDKEDIADDLGLDLKSLYGSK